MLSGRRAFGGATASDTLVADPEPRAGPLRPAARRRPRRSATSSRAASRRTPERRLRDVRDARMEIESALGQRRSGSREGASSVRRRVARRRGGRRSRRVVVFLWWRASRTPATSPGADAAALPVTFAEGVEQFPAWSPDGTQLAYTAEVGGVRQIFVKNLASGAERRVTSSRFDDIQPAWSPDGRDDRFVVRSRQAGKQLQPADVFGLVRRGRRLVPRPRVREGERASSRTPSIPPSRPTASRSRSTPGGPGRRRIWVVGRRRLQPAAGHLGRLGGRRPRRARAGRRTGRGSSSRTSRGPSSTCASPTSRASGSSG